MFEYLPLKAGELIGRLSFSSSELGVYQYDLNLTATPAGSEAPVHFRTAPPWALVKVRLVVLLILPSLKSSTAAR